MLYSSLSSAGVEHMASGLPNWVPLVGIIGVIVLVFGFWVIGVYNGEISRDQGVQGAWSNVEVQYQRRFDLVPNLVNTVKGVAGFEQETLTKLTALRSQWQTQTNVNERITTANQFESTISKLLLITENYPELRATQAFQDLMVQLEGTENRISTERTRYNDAAREYNVYISVIPNSFFLGGKQRKTFFESASGTENPPQVPTDFTP